MTGFRDLGGAGLTQRVLPQPASIVVIGPGGDPVTVERAAGRRPLRSLVAALSPGRVRVHGERVECVEVCLSPPAAHALLGVSPRELDGSVTGLDDLWGPHARRLRERLTDAPTWRERLAPTDAFLAEQATGAPSMAPWPADTPTRPTSTGTCRPSPGAHPARDATRAGSTGRAGAHRPSTHHSAHHEGRKRLWRTPKSKRRARQAAS